MSAVNAFGSLDVSGFVFVSLSSVAVAEVVRFENRREMGANKFLPSRDGFVVVVNEEAARDEVPELFVRSRHRSTWEFRSCERGCERSTELIICNEPRTHLDGQRFHTEVTGWTCDSL